MIYALICVCRIAMPTCDPEHAIWADQSPPFFDTEDECLEGGISRAIHVFRPPSGGSRPHLSVTKRRYKSAQYQIAVTCTEAGAPV